MGDYANDMLRYHATHMWHNPSRVARRPKTHACEYCERVLRGSAALKEHMKAKHKGTE